MKAAINQLKKTSRAYLAGKANLVHDGAPVTHQIIVAGVLAHEGRFLLVEEHVDGILCLNHPAGRLEPGESPMDGAVRETWEEAGVRFEPTHLLGIYEWHSVRHNKLFVRIAYTGRITASGDGKPKDPNIVRVTWLNYEQARAEVARHRSPFVLSCIEDYLQGVRHPLELIKHFVPS